MSRLENRLMTGMNAPQMHRSCSISALGNHFSVIVITISSFDTKLNPSMAGKEIKAVKRNSFLNTASCRALSSATRVKTGCAMPFIMPVIVVCPMPFHLFACVKLPTSRSE